MSQRSAAVQPDNYGRDLGFKVDGVNVNEFFANAPESLSTDEMDEVVRSLKKLKFVPLAAGINEIRFGGKTCLAALVPNTRLFIAYTIKNQYIIPEGVGLRVEFGLPS